ncbi:MAG: DUF1214 domain-containing protein [Pantoea sp.]|uniref:DUF1214 domain-containing protein n=1 Tax=Pantoea sp. TaxID=69393 RepID=UPI0039E2F270
MKLTLPVVFVGLNLSFSAIAAQQVTPENYARAEVDLSYQNIVKDVGSNKFRHDRNLIPLDKQPAVTMNRDTVYSFGIYYVPKGTTITLPKSKDDRYQSAMIMQNDDYTDQVFYGPGTFDIKSQTEFVAIVVRTQVNPNDADDINYVHQLQDKISVNWPTGTKVKEYKRVDWDQKSLMALRHKYEKEAAKLPNLNETSGARGKVDPLKLNLGASVALGLLPPEHAVYIYRDFGLSGNKCYKATYNKPDFKPGGFFSFTMYGADKYLHSENSHLSNRDIKMDKDGKFTIYYGPKAQCGNVENWLPTPGDNWYLGMRIYRPGESVIDGTYTVPTPVEIK